MNQTAQQDVIRQWACAELAPFYTQGITPTDFLALKQVHHDVIVIGPDGRKFRLQHCPEMQPRKRKTK
jgi:hypothetical protein